MGEEFRILIDESAEHSAQAMLAGNEIGSFDPFQGEKDNGIAGEVLRIGMAGACDGEVIEEVPELFAANIEEAAEHGQIEGFAEAAGSWKENGEQAGAINQIADEERFIDINELSFAEQLEVVDADGNVEMHGLMLR